MTYTIPLQNLSVLRYRIADLNKRADKLGVAHVSLTEGEPYSKRITVEAPEGPVTRREAVVDCEVEGERIGLPGWTFVGTVEHTDAGNILRAAPGREIPESYRDIDNRCEHCGTRRSRRNTFVVEHDDGSLMQVGRQCTADFLGHIDPERLASWLAILFDLDADPSDRDRSRSQTFYLPAEVVSLAVAAVRSLGGFRPASFGVESTADTVRLALSGSDRSRELLAEAGFDFPTDADLDEAADLLDWIADAPADNGYLQNLKVAAANEFATAKHIGLLASLPKARQSDAERELQRQQREAARAERESQRRPAPEGRVEVEGEVIKLSVVEHDFGVTDKMTVAAEGFAVYVSVPTSIISEVEIGTRVKFTATLTQSDREASFAFGSRPSKAEVLS